MILPIDSYLRSVDMLRRRECDAVFPYGGEFVDLSGAARLRFLCELRVESIDHAAHELLHDCSVGGALFWSRQSFLEGGMENENFVAWGFEDNERVSRYSKLGHTFKRVAGSLFHLSHVRTCNSWYANPCIRSNQRELARISAMSRDELRAHVASWPWLHENATG